MSARPKSPVDRNAAGRPKGDPQRSSITNGKKLLPGIDQRSAWVRRCKDLMADHFSDLGGIEIASAAERSIIRRAAVLTTELEQIEVRFALNQARENDLDLYQRTAGNLRRLLEAVGLQRRPREVSGLSELWRADQRPPVDNDHADR
jgi:hypothetical protein